MLATDLPDQLTTLADSLRRSITALTVPHHRLSSAKEKDTFRDAIDSGIKLLSSLKTYRNKTVSAISSLPDEILAEVFHHVMMSDPWSTKWTKVMKVCWRWHDVGMDNGRLWSWIAQGHGYRDTHGAFEKEELSQGAPLSLLLRHDNEYKILLQRNFHRTVLLRLDGTRSKIRYILDEIHRLPVLTTLHIDTHGSGEGEDSEEWNLPAFIFEGGAPKLCQLRLNNLSFQHLGYLNNINNFTHLELMKSPGQTMSPLPSIHDMYDLIRRSPQLQVLRIHHFITIDPEPRSRARGAVMPLHHLEFLEIWGIVPHATGILWTLELPPSARISLNVYPMQTVEATYAEQFKTMMVQVKHHMVVTPDIPPLRSAIFDCNGNRLSFSFSHQDSCPDPILSMSPEKPDLHLQAWPQSQHEIRQIITQIVNFLPLDELRSLDALKMTSNTLARDDRTSFPGISPQTWRTLLRVLPSELTVTIGVNDGMVVLLQAIIDTMRSFSTAQHRTRHQKRRCRTQGLGSRPLSKLVLWAAHHPKIIDQRWQLQLHNSPGEPPYDRKEDQRLLYDALQTFLADYAELETPLKKKGEHFPSIQFVFEGGWFRACEIADELFAVTGELRLNESVWDPVENRKARMEHRDFRRRLREKYPDLPPLSDSDVSPLSSDHESDSGE